MRLSAHAIYCAVISAAVTLSIVAWMLPIIACYAMLLVIHPGAIALSVTAFWLGIQTHQRPILNAAFFALLVFINGFALFYVTARYHSHQQYIKAMETEPS